MAGVAVTSALLARILGLLGDVGDTLAMAEVACDITLRLQAQVPPGPAPSVVDARRSAPGRYWFRSNTRSHLASTLRDNGDGGKPAGMVRTG